MTKRFAEFFAGGGMVRAALSDKWQLAFANDIDVAKCRAYRENFGPTGLIEGDIASLDARLLRQPVDLYWASSPCQDLSLAGNRVGLKGKRSSTFHNWINLVNEANQSGYAPKVLAFENVTGLLSSNKGQDFIEVLDAFNQAGYRFGALEINAVEFLPHSRPRLFVIGLRKDVQAPSGLVHNEPCNRFHPAKLRKIAADLPPELKVNWVWWNLPEPQPVDRDLSDFIDLAGSIFDDRKRTTDLISLMEPPSLFRLEKARDEGGLHVGTIYKRGRPDSSGHIRQRAELRLDGIAGCLRTPRGGSSRQTLIVINAGEIATRLLTAREAVRLMGLPDSYILPSNYNDAYRIAGDGVAVPVVRFLSENLFNPLVAMPAVKQPLDEAPEVSKECAGTID